MNLEGSQHCLLSHAAFTGTPSNTQARIPPYKYAIVMVVFVQDCHQPWTH